MKTTISKRLDFDLIINSLEKDGVAVISTQIGYAILSITELGTEKLYNLKNRPQNKPSGILATKEIFESLSLSRQLNAVKKLTYPVGIIEKPNPEHIAYARIPSFCFKNNTLAYFLNMDKNLAQLAALAWERGRVIVVSSANKSGKGNAYTLESLHKDFKEKTEIFIDCNNNNGLIERENLDNITATILDLTRNKMVRKGVFAERVLGEVWKNGISLNTSESKNETEKPTAFSSCIYLLSHKENVYKQMDNYSEVDWIVLDLEDGCPPKEKEKGRNLIETHGKTSAYKKRKVAVRLNGLDSKEELLKDLKVGYSTDIKGFALPMLNSKEDVLEYETLISELEDWLGFRNGHFGFFPIIETVKGINNAIEIANASKRNIALFLGHADLFSETNSERNVDVLNQVRFKYLLAAKSAGIHAFDTPYENTWDLEGLRVDSLAAKKIGLQGKVALNEKQVNIINGVFKTSAKQKTRIKRVLEQYGSGCELIEGEFVAPPIVKKYKYELRKSEFKKQGLSAKGIKGRTIDYGLDFRNVSPGTIVSAPYETTVDESWITAWQALVQTGNPLETSKEYCTELGLRKRLIPFHCLVNLGLCLAVECFSESSIFHLGISNVKYEKPAFVGDTIKSIMKLDKIKPSSNGKYAVFYTTMVLINQNDEVLVRMNRNSLFPYIDPNDVPMYKEDVSNEFYNVFSKPKNDFKFEIFKNALKSNHYSFNLQKKFTSGELILHSIAKPIGLSNSLAFSTLCKNTHPLHINSARYGLDGLVVCGGFIIPMMHAAASRDIRFALAQEIVDSMHINKIHHEDCVGAMTYVENSTIENGIECLTLRTFGLKNIDAEKDLPDVSIPIDLLASKEIKPNEIELLCDVYCPELAQRVCARMTWKIWRKLN